jgi:hypothetical protein
VCAPSDSYADAHRFEKAIRHQMATTLTATELHRLRNVFEKLDVEGTGSISIKELQSTLQSQSSDDKTKEILSKLDLTTFDLDGDGSIDWQEFVAGAMEVRATRRRTPRSAHHAALTLPRTLPRTPPLTPPLTLPWCDGGGIQRRPLARAPCSWSAM